MTGKLITVWDWLKKTISTNSAFIKISYFTKPSWLRWQTIGLVILLLGLPAGIYLSQHQAIFTPRAAELTSSQMITKNIPIVVLEYLPLDPNDNKYIDRNEVIGSVDHFGLDQKDLLASSVQDRISQGLQQAIDFLNDASRYHGYKDGLSQPYLRYVLADVPKIINDTIPLGPQLALSRGDTAHSYNYALITYENGLCNWVNNHGVRELWIFGYHTEKISPDESHMVGGPDGGIAIGTLEKDLSIENQSLKCNHSYTIYSYEYPNLGLKTIFPLSIGAMIHDHMHQLEELISYAANDDPYPIPHDVVENGIKGEGVFWDNFALHTGIATNTGCGITHFPPNTVVKFKYDEVNKVQSNCEDWNPDPAQSIYKSVNCTEWGCTDTGFYKWWMQNIPGYANNISHNGKGMRNWWDLVADLDGFIKEGRSLYCDHAYCSGIPPEVPKPSPNNDACRKANPNGFCAPRGFCLGESDQVLEGPNYCGATSGTVCCISRAQDNPTPIPTFLPDESQSDCQKNTQGYCTNRATCLSESNSVDPTHRCLMSGNICCDQNTPTPIPTNTPTPTPTNTPAAQDTKNACESSGGTCIDGQSFNFCKLNSDNPNLPGACTRNGCAINQLCWY